MPAKRRLNNLFSQMKMVNSATASDCIRIFSLTRELVEANNQFRDYPTLKFFTDWSLHPKLSRQSAKNLLNEIATIIKNNESSNPKNIVVDVSKSLSIAKLHSELLLIFKDANITDFILRRPDLWNQCVTMLIQDLIEKPIIGSEFTKEEVKTGCGIIPRQLKLIEKNNQIMWVITCGPRVKLQGLLINFKKKQKFWTPTSFPEHKLTWTPTNYHK